MVAAMILVLSGPPGVGKTTVGWRVFDRCTDRGDDPGFVDLDLLGAAWPAPADDPHQSRLKATNLAAVWRQYRAGGTRRLIIAAVVESPEERRRLEQAVGGPVVVCALTAPPDELGRRIRDRGRDHDDDQEKLIMRAGELAHLLRSSGGHDVTVPTHERSLDEVAADVLHHWDTLPGPSA